MGKYESDARELLRLVGGRENIVAVTHCVTRMRFALVDPSKADVPGIEKLKVVKGSFTNAGQFQVIIGNDVADFYDDFTAVSGVSEVSKADVKKAAVGNQNPFQRAMGAIAEVFAPLIPAIITGGGTGTFGLEAASGLWNELQPGSFLFMDADYARNERDNAQPAFEQALFVKSQVISVQDGHAVCDAGCKSIALDSGPPLVHALPGQPALIYASGGDEHGILRPATAGGPLPAVGDTVWLIPSHCDPTVNLHDAMIAVQGGLAAGAVSAVVRVDARGA